MDGVCNHTWDDAEAQEELVLTVVEHTILDDIRDIGDTHTQSNFEIALEGSMARSHDKGADILPGETLVFNVNMDSIEPIAVEKETRPLTKEEMIKHRTEIISGKFKEVGGLNVWTCFKTFPR